MSLSQVKTRLSCQHGISLEVLLPHLAGVIAGAPPSLQGGLLLISVRPRR